MTAAWMRLTIKTTIIVVEVRGLFALLIDWEVVPPFLVALLRTWLLLASRYVAELEVGLEGVFRVLLEVADVLEGRLNSRFFVAERVFHYWQTVVVSFYHLGEAGRFKDCFGESRCLLVDREHRAVSLRGHVR
jgi:hypothetical protein